MDRAVRRFLRTPPPQDVCTPVPMATKDSFYLFIEILLRTPFKVSLGVEGAPESDGPFFEEVFFWKWVCRPGGKVPLPPPIA